MPASERAAAAGGLRGWWASPARSGARRLIAPWEYRHLRAWAWVHGVAGGVLAGLGVLTLSFGGGGGAQTYGWTAAFLAIAAAQVGFACWERAIVRSTSDRPHRP